MFHVIACRLAPSHYLNLLCWDIINWILGNKLRLIMDMQWFSFQKKKTFKNVVCKIVATLSQYLPPGALIRWMFFSTSTMSRFFRNSLPFFNLDKQGKEIDGLMQKRCSNSSVLAIDLHLFHYPIESDSLEAVKSHELSKLQRYLGFLPFCMKFFHKQKFIFQNINGQRNILSNL